MLTIYKYFLKNQLEVEGTARWVSTLVAQAWGPQWGSPISTSVPQHGEGTVATSARGGDSRRRTRALTGQCEPLSGDQWRTVAEDTQARGLCLCQCALGHASLPGAALEITLEVLLKNTLYLPAPTAFPELLLMKNITVEEQAFLVLQTEARVLQAL